MLDTPGFNTDEEDDFSNEGDIRRRHELSDEIRSTPMATMINQCSAEDSQMGFIPFKGMHKPVKLKPEALRERRALIDEGYTQFTLPEDNAHYMINRATGHMLRC